MFNKFLAYVIPSVISMLVTAMYVVVDGIFVGRGVGTLALAAVNLVLPFTIVLFGVSMMFSVGAGVLIAKSFGEGNFNYGIYVFRLVANFLLVLSVVMGISFYFFAEDIVVLLGAKNELVSLASDYFKYYVIFSIPATLAIALNVFVRNDERPRLAMLSSMGGALLNVLLDYIFIFIFEWGVIGAAIATGLGQVLSVAILLPHFLLKRGHLSFGKAKFDKKLISQSTILGFPVFFSESSSSIVVFFYNFVLLNFYGNLYLSSFSIINYIDVNIYMILLGISFGIQPLISFNLGQKNVENMLKIFNYAIKFALVFVIIYCIFCYFFGHMLISIFTDDEKIINIASHGLNLYNLAFLMMAINFIQAAYYQAIGKAGISNFICFVHSIVFLPIMIFTLERFFGLNGVWLAFLTAELLAFIVINLKYNLRKITKEAI